MAARLWLEIQSELAVDLPLERLGTHASLGQLAALIEEHLEAGSGAGGSPAAVPEVRARPADRSRPFPLTPIQQAYLIGKQPDLTADSVGCHLYREFQLEGLDVDRLRAAWQRVIEHHDVLRLVVTPDGRQRVQDPPPSWSLLVHEAPGEGEEDLVAQVKATRRRLSHRRYEPGEWPLFAIEVTRSAQGKSVIHFSLDAILTDGYGLSLLLSHWWRCYHQPDAPLAEPVFSVRDCVLALEEHRASAAYRDDLEYWVRRLEGLPPGPRLTAPPAAAPGAGDRGLERRPVGGSLSAEQWRAVLDRAASLDVSPTSLLLTLFADVLACHGAEPPFSLVLTTSSRLRLPREAEEVVGPFTSTTVLLVEETLDRTVGEVAQAIHQRLWQDLGHAGVSGVSALRELKARGKLPVQPALPVVFTSLLDVGPVAAGDVGFAAATTYALSQTTGVALDHQVWEQDGELHFRWDVAEALFSPGTVDTLVAAFTNALLALAAEEPERAQVRPLNELQKAYYVSRTLNPRGDWNGCQVYHRFSLADLDLSRLEAAWLSMVRAHDVLRSVVTLDGRLLIRAGAPERWLIPLLDLTERDDPEAVQAAIQDEMAGRAFPLGRWPQFDLRVTRDEPGGATVHCAIDLTIADGRSTHLLFRELFRLYANPEAKPRIAAPLDEYLRRQSVLHTSPDYPSWVVYWQARFRAMPSGPRLEPGDPPSPQRRRVRFQGSLPSWRRCRAEALARGLSPDMLLLAAFTRALSAWFRDPFTVTVVRWTEAEERFRPAEVTALSWVTSEAPEPPLPEQAARYQREIDRDPPAAALNGLAELRKQVMKERRKGALAFPVVYTGLLELAENRLPPGVRLGEWMTYTPEVSLDAIAIDEGDELRYFWDAVEADFPGGALGELFAGYQRLLEDLAAGGESWQASRLTLPSAAVSVRPSAAGPAALSAAQRHQLLREWNDTATDFLHQTPVHHQFERRAAERPEATALRWRGGTMSYGELNRRANCIAWALKGMGVGAETVVAISVRRGPALVAAVFGVLKAGAAYLPTEPSLPRDRAAVMLADARASVLLTIADSSGFEPPAEIPVLEAGPGLLALELAGAARDPEPTATADNTAYVIFTSGSTGRPKGVAVAHRAVLNLLAWCYRAFGFRWTDLGLAVTSLSFDLSVFDILGLLGHGAGLYLADEEQRKDPELLLDLLLTEPITFWNSAPTTLGQLTPLLPDALGHPGAGHLRLVFLSGDYTPLSLPDAVRRVFHCARIISLGGATEATVWSNSFVVGEIDPEWRSVPYGRAMDNARYHLLDSRLEPCPVGSEGDLYIAGECLSRGYYNQPALTAERFVPDPFAQQGGERMYATGDRGAYFPDGQICFLGRADDQVKVRGFRVEPGEIEHRLRQHPAVQEVVVLARRDGTGERKLVAYVVPASAPPSVKELRAHAAEALPDYMVPSFVAFLERFPATPNGKLDRDALPWPVDDGGEPPAAGPAHERLSAELAALFAELLGVARIDPQEDLWDQGATSFTMVQVSNALKQQHRLRIPVSALVAEPTIAGIARHLAAGLAQGGSQEGERREIAGPAGGGVGAAAAGGAAGHPEAGPPPAAPASSETAAGGEPPPVDFFSARERAAFKQAGWSLRSTAKDGRLISLAPVDIAPEHFAWRASYREFLDHPVGLESLCRLLGLLREASVEGRRRHLYPSAGETYAVQTYLHVRPGAVEGLAEGVYYYHPRQHALEVIHQRPRIDRAVHFPYNRPLFDRAGFGLYLIGQTRGIEPLYREDSERFLLLEAGYMGQLLMMGQAACGIGLCPVGTLAFERIRDQFDLDPGHRFLHAFLGGPMAHRRLAVAGVRPPFSDHEPLPGDGVEVAVIGLAGHYPDAADAEALWRNLSVGKRSIGPLPASRRQALGQRWGEGGESLPSGGFLRDIDRFDSLLFQISPREARSLDPQLRLLLTTVWECLENAGYTPASLAGVARRVGVFVGVMWHDYEHLGADEWQRTGVAQVSGVAADIPNRISHYFDFQGPSLAVNTSCSSSLTALHLAVESLRRGECEAAVVAAVNLVAHRYHLELLSGLNLISDHPPEGAFDGGSSGWSPGEGAGAVLLRPAAAAEEDRDFVHGIIEGTWVGHSGHNRRFGAPDPTALARSISRALDHAGLVPENVHYVECAASGASLADAAEIEALGQVFAGAGPASLPVGTVKPNLGHLEAASGLSQLTKVLLQMRHRQIAPTLMSARTSPLVSWPGSPVRAVDRLEPWETPPGGGPLRALINAFGATGSYGHLVVRTPGERALEVSRSGQQIILLSAANRPQLVTAARRLHDHLAAAEPAAPDLADVAFTLQTGRVHQACRLALVCADRADLLAGLDAFARGEARPGLDSALVDGTAQGDESLPPTPRQAVEAWLAGRPVPWHRYWDPPGRRVPLPGTPLAGDRYWLDEAAAASLAAESPGEDHGDGGQRVRIEAYLKEVYSQVSGIPRSQLHLGVPLERYGLSSLLIARLNRRLEQDLGEVSRTLFFEHRDLAGVADYLVSRGVDPSSRPAAGAAPGRPSGGEPAAGGGERREAHGTGDGVAIIGLAGRYPQAPDLDRFWRNLETGRDSITPLPEERRREGWPTDLMWGGFLDQVDCFDPLFFNVTPRDAALMDPQERLFLEVVWQALEDAGYPRTRLRQRHRSRVAVFVGAMYNEYPFFGVEQSLRGTPVTSGSALAGIANRVSYFLDLQGPSMAVDTMCSSSLTAIHLAVESLQRGEYELAIAGGVNLNLHPNKYLQQERLGMSSSDHRCRSFGRGGDGLVPGEGVGAVLLKPLAHAVTDGDRIHAVIRGTAVNHGGKTNGYMVPNPVAQGALILEALRRAGVSPATVSYVEAHGTGTELGDPVEITGLMRAFAGEELEPGACAIGSVKSNIGHLEAAAGIAGLTKVVLQMTHRRLLPSLHARELNPNIDWVRSPFRLQRQLADWPPCRRGGQTLPRRAGVSSFGAGGANAHVILEEYERPEAEEPGASAPMPHLVVLSARDEDRLVASAAGLAAFLRRGMRSPGLGRPEPEELMQRIARLASGELPPELSANGSASPREVGAYLMAAWAQHGDSGGGEGAHPRVPRLQDLAFTLQVGREPLRERLALVVSELGELAERLERFAQGEPAGVLRGRAPATGEPTGSSPLGPGEPAAEDLAAVAERWVAGGEVDWSRLHRGRSPEMVGLPTYPFARVRCWLPEPEQRQARPAASYRREEISLYEKSWVVAPPPGRPPQAISGPIVCLFQQRSEAVARELAERVGNERILLLREGGKGGDGTPGYRDEASARSLMESLLARHPDLEGWIDLCDLYREGADPGPWTARLAMLQQLLGRRRGAALRLLLVTRGLHDLPGPEPSLAGARMAGWIRLLGGEYRALSGRVVDTDLTVEEAGTVAGQIVAEWAARDPACEICYRRGRRHEPRLSAVVEAGGSALSLAPDQAYLVTGGTGGLGALVARHLVRRGARKLALFGVRPLPPRERWQEADAPEAARATVALIRDLEAAGARVLVYTGPLTRRRELGGFLARVRGELGEIGGVIHCAGRSSQGRPSFVHKELAEVRAVAEPKVDGLEVLAQQCSEDRPAFFVLFSSISAVVPSLAAGVSDYAAANAFMDAFAGYQVRCGRSWFRSIDWPLWRQTGAGRGRPDAGARIGLGSISDDEGLDLLERVLALPAKANLVPCPAAGERFDPGSLLVVRGDPASTSAPAAAAAEPGAAPPPAWLVELFSESLEIPAEDLDPAVPFGELGVESVMLAELVEKIEAHLGRPVEPSTLLDHPTLGQLASHLASQGQAASGERTRRAAPAIRPAAAAGEDKIAVIGIACRLPGAPDVATLWDNLIAGRCAVTEVPASRWDVQRLYRTDYQEGTSISKWGGFVDGIEEFDPSYFAMTAEEALCLDPGIRLLLEGAVTCLRDAGYAEKDLWGRDVGVFVGARMSGYRRRCGIRSRTAGLGGDQNFIAARIAHQLDFHGPNLVVDSACSSALVSVQLACRSLLAGESELALAGGVEILLDEEPYLEFTAARALSPSGRCATFDQSAAGFVPGEGCGVVLLKPLGRALADGDRIHAVIDAVAVNNDGHTMGLTTPNPVAQAEVVRRALAASGLRADDLGMIEAHGAGTRIGDPIELRALTDVFRETTDRCGFCAIGSVKSNLGHLLSAAGIAGLLKVILALEHGEIPPTLFCDSPNPRLDFANSPFFPNARLRDFSARDRPPAAGVSAFGLGGTNAHLIASQLDPGLRAGPPAAREALPPPVFHRRRLWLERPPAGGPAAAGAPATVPAPDEGLVASLLDLHFGAVAEGAEDRPVPPPS